MPRWAQYNEHNRLIIHEHWYCSALRMKMDLIFRSKQVHAESAAPERKVCMPTVSNDYLSLLYCELLKVLIVITLPCIYTALLMWEFMYLSVEKALNTMVLSYARASLKNSFNKTCYWLYF